MTWQGFLDEQTATATNPAYPGVTGAYLEAHAHSPHNYPLPAPVSVSVSVSPATASTSTGVSPLETSYSAYGKTIPLSVLGKAVIGGNIVVGPWLVNGLASFGISFGVPADPTGTRILRGIAFDSEVVWHHDLGFLIEAFTYRFYQGTYTQAADALETAHFGASAVAYRPQMMLFFENLPLANTKFRKIPYVAAVIGDTTDGAVPEDGINLGQAFETLAYSPWVGFTSAQFETVGVTDILDNGGLIFAEQKEFLPAIQEFGRFYRSWDILQTDKLRIVDRGATVTADVTLDKTRLMDKIVIQRAEPNSVPRILELSTIDPDADYTIIPSRAQRPRAPVAVSSSVQTEQSYLPAIMDSPTRTAIVTYAKYQEEQGRKTISGTAMMYGLEMEPGDLVSIEGLGDGFHDETFKVTETLHGANYSVEFTAQSILKCLAPPASYPAFFNNGTITQSTSVHTGTLPSTRINGNVLIFFFKIRSTTNNPTVSAGWTLVDNFGFSGSTFRYGAYYAYVTGAEVAPTLTWSGGSHAVSLIAQYSGIKDITPTAAGTKNGSQTGTTLTCSAITSSQSGTLAISASWDDLAVAPTLPSGFTNQGVGFFQNVYGSLRLCQRQIPTAGSSSGSVICTQAVGNPWGSLLFELKGV